MEKEIWKDIIGFEGLYQVSNFGYVKSLEREIERKDGKICTIKEKILRNSIDSKKTPFVRIYKNGIPTKKRLSVLVSEAFIGVKPEGYDICHSDGDSLNNKVDNLRYDTRSENMNDMYRYGKKNGSGKLSIEDVLNIREMYKTNKYTQKDIADMYGVKSACISKIICRSRFSWLNDDGTIEESKTAIK